MREIDENGSQRIRVRSEVRVLVRRRIPVEGRFEDSDGVPVLVLPHCFGDKVDEPEDCRDGSTNGISSALDHSRLELLCPPLVR